MPIPSASRPPARSAPVEHIEPFPYPSDPSTPCDSPSFGWPAFGSPALGSPALGSMNLPGEGSDGSAQAAGFEQRLAEETRRAFEAGRARGLDEQRQASAAEQAAAREREKRQHAALLETFHAERDRFLHQVEQEVVRLALAVAARILRREAQMDPLLLTGAVRVALGQLANTTEIRLRVPAADLALWTEAIALVPNLPVKPTLAGDDALRLGECVVETRLGQVDLGIRSQLGEIERGFFDRAPAAPPILEAGSGAASSRAAVPDPSLPERRA